MHHVLIFFLTVTSTQGHTDRNHENHRFSIIWETVQAIPTKFAVKIIRRKVYMTFAIPMSLSFTQDLNCVSNVTIVTLYNNSNILDNIQALAYLGMTVPLDSFGA